MFIIFFIFNIFLLSNLNSSEIKKNDEFLYSIHQTWINNTINKEEFITSEDNLKNIILWDDKQEKKNEYYISFLYNKSTVTEDQLLRTKEYLEGHKNIVLEDICELPGFRTNPEILNKPIPLFFILDLSRPIKLVNARSRYAIHADLDIPPMSKEELFYKDIYKAGNTKESAQYYQEARTPLSLSRFGLVGCDGMQSDWTPENSFMILDRDNVEMKKAFQIILIDANIYRAKKALEDEKFGKEWNPKDIKNSHKNPMKEDYKYVALQEIVYQSFSSLIKTYYLLKKKARLVENSSFEIDKSNIFDLIDFESARFKKSIEAEVFCYICDKSTSQWEEKEIRKTFLPNDVDALINGFFKKQVGQPISQFVGSSF